MREIVTESRSVVGDNQESMDIRYAILEEEAPAGHFGCTRYGIRIEKQNGEWDEVRDITTSRTQIDELFRLLCRNDVTPMSLRDILEDWFGAVSR